MADGEDKNDEFKTSSGITLPTPTPARVDTFETSSGTKLPTPKDTNNQFRTSSGKELPIPSEEDSFRTSSGKALPVPKEDEDSIQTKSGASLPKPKPDPKGSEQPDRLAPRYRLRLNKRRKKLKDKIDTFSINAGRAKNRAESNLVPVEGVGGTMYVPDPDIKQEEQQMLDKRREAESQLDRMDKLFGEGKLPILSEEELEEEREFDRKFRSKLVENLRKREDELRNQIAEAQGTTTKVNPRTGMTYEVDEELTDEQEKLEAEADKLRQRRLSLIQEEEDESKEGTTFLGRAGDQFQKSWLNFKNTLNNISNYSMANRLEIYEAIDNGEMSQQMINSVPTYREYANADPEEKEQMKDSLIQDMSDNTAQIVENRGKSEDLYSNPMTKEMVEADSFEEGFDAFMRNPIDAITGLSAESSMQMVPGMTLGALGAATGNPAAAFGGFALGSGSIEFGASLGEGVLNEASKDSRTQQYLNQKLSDAGVLDEGQDGMQQFQNLKEYQEDVVGTLPDMPQDVKQSIFDDLRSKGLVATETVDGEEIERFSGNPEELLQAIGSNERARDYLSNNLPSGKYGGINPGDVKNNLQRAQQMGEVISESVKDKESVLHDKIMNVLQDDEVMSDIGQRAAIRGGVIGTVEGLSATIPGAAVAKQIGRSRAISRALGETAKMSLSDKARVGGSLALGVLGDAAGGGAGEAGAQLATDGEIKAGEVLAEAAPELISGPFEVGSVAKGLSNANLTQAEQDVVNQIQKQREQLNVPFQHSPNIPSALRQEQSKDQQKRKIFDPTADPQTQFNQIQAEIKRIEEEEKEAESEQRKEELFAERERLYNKQMDLMDEGADPNQSVPEPYEPTNKRESQPKTEELSTDQPLYHGTIEDFDSFEVSDEGAVWVTPSQDLAREFTDHEDPNIREVSVEDANFFDYRNEDHVDSLIESLVDRRIENQPEGDNRTREDHREVVENYREDIKTGDWRALEDALGDWTGVMQDAGFDGAWMVEKGQNSLAVFDSNLLSESQPETDDISIESPIDEMGEVDYEAEEQVRQIAKDRDIGITRDRELDRVARDAEGNVVGGAYTSWDGDTYTFDVVVSEEAEGQGIGSRLLDDVIEMPPHLEDINPDANIEVDVVNPQMRQMLENRGFEVIEEREGDRVIMAPSQETQQSDAETQTSEPESTPEQQAEEETTDDQAEILGRQVEEENVTGEPRFFDGIAIAARDRQTGEVFVGGTSHADLISQQEQNMDMGRTEMGFYTPDGRYLTREEAAQYKSAGEPQQETQQQEQQQEIEQEEVPQGQKISSLDDQTRQAMERAGMPDAAIEQAESPDIVANEEGQPAQTGQPIRVEVFQGKGRENQSSVYNEGAQGPILGEGNYFALNENEAQQFGPEVEQSEVTLQNPLVINSDRELAKWMMGDENAAIPTSNEERSQRIDEFRERVEEAGHDGVIVNVPRMVDMNQQGESIKRTREVFGQSQVIKFPSAEPQQRRQGRRLFAEDLSDVSATEIPVMDGQYNVRRDRSGITVTNTRTGQNVGRQSNNYNRAVAEAIVKDTENNSEFINDEDIDNEQQWLQEVAQQSNNPLEIAQAYQIAKEIESIKQESSSAEALQEFFDNGGRIRPQDFAEYNDPVKLSDDNRLRFYTNEEATPLDKQAQELSTISGVEIEPEQIVDFLVDDYINQERQVDQVSESLRERFQEITGTNLTDQLAQEIEQQEFDEFTDEQGEILPEVDALIENYIDDQGNIDYEALWENELSEDQNKGFFTEFPGTLTEQEYQQLKQEVQNEVERSQSRQEEEVDGTQEADEESTEQSDTEETAEEADPKERVQRLNRITRNALGDPSTTTESFIVSPNRSESGKEFSYTYISRNRPVGPAIANGIKGQAGEVRIVASDTHPNGSFIYTTEPLSLDLMERYELQSVNTQPVIEMLREELKGQTQPLGFRTKSENPFYVIHPSSKDGNFQLTTYSTSENGGILSDRQYDNFEDFIEDFPNIDSVNFLRPTVLKARMEEAITLESERNESRESSAEEVGLDISSPEYGAENQIVTKDRVDEARQRIREKLGGQFNAGIDPSVLKDMMEVALYHLEAGSRRFSRFASAMIDDVGENVKPYLRTLYKQAKYRSDIPEQDFSSDTEIIAWEQENLEENNLINSIDRDFRERVEEQEAQGYKSMGRPELANPVNDEQARDAVDYMDEQRKQQGKPSKKSDKVVNREAHRRLDEDYEGEKARLFNMSEEYAAGQWNDVDVKMAKIIMGRESQEALASGNKADLFNFFLMTGIYRDVGTEQARAMRMRRDDVKSPEERRAEMAKEVFKDTKQTVDIAVEIHRLAEQAQRGEITKEEFREQVRAKLDEYRSQREQNKGTIQTAIERLRGKRIRNSELDDIYEAAQEGEQSIQEHINDNSAKLGLPKMSIAKLMQLESHIENVEAAPRGIARNKALLELMEFLEESEIVGGKFSRGFRAAVDDILGRDSELFDATEDILQSVRNRVMENITQALLTPPKELQQKMDEAETQQERQEIWDEYYEEHFLPIKEAVQKDMGVDIENLTEEDIKDPVLMNDILRRFQAANANFDSKFYEFWNNAILSALTTHFVNFAGTGANMFYKAVPERFFEAVTNTLAQEENKAQWGELRYFWKGFFTHIPEAWKYASLAFQTETRLFAEEVGLQEGVNKFQDKKESGAAIKGKTGRIIRMLGWRPLTMMDEFFKVISFRMQLSAEAFREAKRQGMQGEEIAEFIEAQQQNPTGQIAEAAWGFALEVAFQEEPGSITKGFTDFREKHPLFKYAFPFVRTPGNLIKQGTRKGPFSFINMIHRLGMASLYKMGITSDRKWTYTKGEATQHLAETFTFYSLLALGMTMFKGEDDDDPRPLITGSGASYRDQSAYRYEQQNYPAQSIRLPGTDTYYSYRRFDPFATMITQSVDAVNAFQEAKDGKEMSDVIFDYMEKNLRLLSDKSYFQFVGDFVRFRQYPRTGLDWVGNFTASFMPNIIRHVARADDPYIRETTKGSPPKTLEDLGEKFAEKTLEKAWPASTNQPPPRVDWLGNPLKKEKFGGAKQTYLFRLLSPAIVVDKNPTEYDEAIINWNNQNPNDTFHPSVPSDKMTINGEEVRLDRQTYFDFAARRGFHTKRLLDDQYRKFDFEIPTEDDIQRIKSAQRKASSIAKENMIEQGIIVPPPSDDADIYDVN